MERRPRPVRRRRRLTRPLKVDPADPRSLAAAVAAAPAGAVIALPAGRFEGPIFVERSLTLKGKGPLATALSGGGRDGVIALVGEGARLRLSGVAIRDGAAQLGGGMRVTGRGAKAELVEVVFTGNRASKAGGALHVEAGEVAVARSLFQTNAAPRGGAISALGTARLTLDDVVIEDNDARDGGGVALREGAALVMREVVIRRNGARSGASGIDARGTRTRAPSIEAVGGAIAGGSPTVILLAAPGADEGVRPRMKATRVKLPRAVAEMAGVESVGS